MPFRTSSDVLSAIEVSPDDSAKRSPVTMANENGDFAWSLDSFSNTVPSWPLTDPRTMLGEGQLYLCYLNSVTHTLEAIIAWLLW